MRFHLAFRPTQLFLQIGQSVARVSGLRSPTWRVTGRSGVATLFVRAQVADGERVVSVDASYHARIVIKTG